MKGVGLLGVLPMDLTAHTLLHPHSEERDICIHQGTRGLHLDSWVVDGTPLLRGYLIPSRELYSPGIAPVEIHEQEMPDTSVYYGYSSTGNTWGIAAREISYLWNTLPVYGLRKYRLTGSHSPPPYGGYTPGGYIPGTGEPVGYNPQGRYRGQYQ
jgi:hypothetical protein